MLVSAWSHPGQACPKRRVSVKHVAEALLHDTGGDSTHPNHTLYTPGTVNTATPPSQTTPCIPLAPKSQQTRSEVTLYALRPVLVAAVLPLGHMSEVAAAGAPAAHAGPLLSRHPPHILHTVYHSETLMQP